MEPKINIGILSAKKIAFIFNKNFLLKEQSYVGNNSVELIENKISFQGKLYDELIFNATDEASFDLLNVVIGIGFHWERKEDQCFEGDLKFIIEENKITAINILPLEKYLLSVISSEMSASSSLELLKAHAIISRSWLMVQINSKNKKQDLPLKPVFSLTNQDNKDPEFIKWYDKDDHANFDVCADDHCQRYQGVSKASTEYVKQAVQSTKGVVLISQDEICDARFSKCCGGISELFENCWQEEHFDYLLPIVDQKNGKVIDKNLSEEEFERYILDGREDDFCNTKDQSVLTQVLNDYDQETPDFYRWELNYTQKELSELIRRKSEIDFGDIIDLIPIERGVSGRLIKLKIIGSKRTLIVGKELEIRKWLSESHLYSAAFIVKKEKKNGVPNFVLHGAGWGHGVGLCQIGAAVMAEKGYHYQEILSHYFKNTELKELY